MLVSEKTVASGTLPPIEIKYSPLIEMTASLNVLCEPEQHPRQNAWAERTLAQMRPELVREMEALAKPLARWALAMDLVCYMEQHDLDSASGFLDSLAKISDAELAYGIFSGLAPLDELEAAIADPGGIGSWRHANLERFFSIEHVREVLADIASLHERLASFLRSYWNEVFEDVWKEIGASEVDALARERLLLSSSGPVLYLEGSHSDFIVGADALLVQGVPERTYPFDSFRRIDVFISSFAGPHLMLNCMDGVFTLYKDVALAAFTGNVSVETVRFLKAIAGDSKMRILRELYQSPKTTKELSDLLGIAPSSISEHLKILRDAELIYPQRVQNSVYNRFLYENYQAFVSYLATYFER